MKFIFKFIFVVLMVGVSFQPSQALDDLELFTYGDSITAGLIETINDRTSALCATGVALEPALDGSGDLRCFGNGAEGVGGYQPELKESLQDIGYNVSIYNYGFSGADTAYLLSNLNTKLNERPNSEYVLLMGGANDASEGVSSSTVKSNLQVMVNIICSLQMTPVLATVTRNLFVPTTQSKVLSINTKIREITSGTGSQSSCSVIQAEVYEAAVDSYNFNSDGLHLSVLGNTAVANEWFSALNLPEIMTNTLTPIYLLLLGD